MFGPLRVVSQHLLTNLKLRTLPPDVQNTKEPVVTAGRGPINMLVLRLRAGQSVLRYTEHLLDQLPQPLASTVTSCAWCADVDLLRVQILLWMIIVPTVSSKNIWFVIFKRCASVYYLKTLKTQDTKGATYRRVKKKTLGCQNNLWYLGIFSPNC